jgi:hypothetical protein
MYPHRIRLRGPWEYELLDPAGEKAPSPGRVVMPCTAGKSGLAGSRVRFRRRFGYPGRIDAHERVWLVFEELSAPLVLAVNGALLGDCSAGHVEIDVTDLLAPRNELTAEMACLAAGRSPWEECLLEVRCLAFLRSLTLTREGGEIHVAGEVVGQAEGSLELYLIADRSPADYAQVAEGGEVRRFNLRTAARNSQDEPITRLKIDLVQGATVWYTVEWAVAAEATQGGGA